MFTSQLAHPHHGGLLLLIFWVWSSHLISLVTSTVYHERSDGPLLTVFTEYSIESLRSAIWTKATLNSYGDTSSFSEISYCEIRLYVQACQSASYASGPPPNILARHFPYFWRCLWKRSVTPPAQHVREKYCTTNPRRQLFWPENSNTKLGTKVCQERQL